LTTVDFIGRDSSSARIRIGWLDDAPGRQSDHRHRARSIRRLAATAGDLGPGMRKTATPPPGDLGIFLGTPPALIKPLLEFGGLKPGQLVADIGCGDGRVLIEAARTFGCSAVGYETDPDLAARARDNARAAGVEDQVEVVLGDGADIAVDTVDLVFAFLPPEAVATILSSVVDRLGPGSRLISHEQLGVSFPIEPDLSRLILADGAEPITGGITVANLWHGRGADR
jgi:SAM-dependent methyltransferase